MTLSVLEITAKEWKQLSEAAHVLSFKERRAASLDRIDFALLAVLEGKPVAYATVRELDAESIYWQYGGAFPEIKGTINVLKVYRMFIAHCAARYRRVTTLVENGNVRYLKLAMAVGFRIMGCRMFKGDVFVELHLDLDQYAVDAAGESVCQA